MQTTQAINLSRWLPFYNQEAIMWREMLKHKTIQKGTTENIWAFLENVEFEF